MHVGNGKFKNFSDIFLFELSSDFNIMKMPIARPVETMWGKEILDNKIMAPTFPIIVPQNVFAAEKFEDHMHQEEEV